MKRRIIVAISLVLLLTLVGFGATYARTLILSKQQQQQDDPHSDTDHEALVASPHSSTGSCGVERWAVKTGTDADASQINLQSTTQTTISSLVSLPTPSNLPASNRIKPTETTVYQLHDTLTQYKLENDSDYHLILDDGAGHTMIVEIPDPACVGVSSPLLSGIQNARSEFDARYNVTTSFQATNIPVTVTGVGFFDFLHGQTGVAPNGIELHAVIDVQFGSSGTPTPTPTATTGPAPTPTATTGPTPTPTISNQPSPTPTATGTPATGNLIQNGGFEIGGNWTYGGQYPAIRTTVRPHTGSYSVRVGMTSGQQGDSTASQTVSIPSSITSASLSFYYWPATNDSGSYAWQEADIVNGSGQVVQQLFRKTANDQTWLAVTFDLSKYRGQTIGIKFLDHENSNGLSYYTYMYVDDVAVTVH